MPSRPSRPQRLRVWRGELRKTSGGLTRDDLVKNSKGKIVSRRKSKQAGEQNNLGVWLRSKGDKFGDKPAKPNKQQPKQAEGPERSKILGRPAKQEKPKVQKPEPRPVPKPRPKLRLKLALKEKPKPKPAPVVPKPKPKPAPAKPKEYGVSKKAITVRNVVRLSRKQQEEARQERLRAGRERREARRAERDAKWAKR